MKDLCILRHMNRIVYQEQMIVILTSSSLLRKSIFLKIYKIHDS